MNSPKFNRQLIASEDMIILWQSVVKHLCEKISKKLLRRKTRKETVMTIFAKRLQVLMDEWRLNRSQVASRVGVAPSTVHRWFTRGSIPNLDVIDTIGQYFNVDSRWLRGVIDERVPYETNIVVQETETKENELDEELVRLISSLTPAQLQRVKDFLAGLRG